LECTIKKSDVLAAIEPILNKTIECAENALTEAKLTIDDINRIVLVGGSSKADWVIEKVKSHFNKDPYAAPDIDLYVSEGAAFYISSTPISIDDNKSKILCPKCGEELKENPTEKTPCSKCGYIGIDVAEYIPKSIGIMTAGGAFGLVLPKGEIENSKDGDSDILISAKRKFGNPPNSESVLINIYETIETLDTEEVDGEYRTKKDYSVWEKDNDKKNLFQFLGDFTLSGLTLAPEGTITIEVTVELDKNKTLRVSATAEGKSGNKELTVDKK